MKNLKLISTILLSVMLVFTISTAVFADNETEDDIWADVNIVEDNNVVEENIANEVENEILFENIEVENEVENEFEEENEYNNLYTTSNSTVSNAENLSDAGIGDSNSIIALIVILSAIVAIYSAKKINDYKNV